MKALSASFAIVSALVLGFTAPASATPITLTATLSGPNESPPNLSPATGFALFVYDGSAHTLGLDVVFAGLQGPDTAAHIHCCTVTPFVGTASVATTVPIFVGFPIAVTAGTFNNLATPYNLANASFWNPAFIASSGGTVAKAEAVFAAGLVDGEEYFNIHTTVVPGGEIRGFLVQTPEPATLALFGAGLAGLGAMQLRRRKQRAS